MTRQTWLFFLLAVVASMQPTAGAAAQRAVDSASASGACGSASVSNGNDAGAGSLRQAIADACVGETITFASGVDTVTLTTSELLADKDVTIDGGTGVAVQRSAAPGTPDFGVIRVAAATTVVIRDLIVRNGKAPSQAGGIMNAGTLTLVRVEVIGNSAPQAGGMQNDGVLTMTDSAIVSNSATIFGGGLIIFGPNTALTNTTIANNLGGSDSGGIGAAGNVTLTNCTISGNEVSSIGAGLVVNNADVTLRNTVVIGNSGAAQIDGAVNLASANNLIGEIGTGGLTNGVAGNLVGVSVQAAGLGTLGNYGGLAASVPLLPGSVAIDNGNSGIAPAFDQRGIARPQLAGVDIGAFESRGYNLNLISGSPQWAALNSTFATPLLVSVVPVAAGEPVNGGLVSYSAPATGASAVLVTDPAVIASGQASVIATANNTEGSYVVTAAGTGINGTATFTLNNVRNVDLGMLLTDSPDPVNAGDNVSYVATLANAGPNDALDVSISLTLSTGTSFVSVVPSAGGVCNAASPVVCNWAGATSTGTTRTATVVALVDANTANGTVLSTTATAAGVGTETAAGNETATATTSVAATGDLSISLSDSPDPVTAGTNLTYTAVVSNAGPANSTGVTLTLPVPTNTSFVSGTVSTGGSCAGAPVVCTISGSMASGASATVTVIVEVSPSAPNGSAISASATVTSDSTDLVPGNNIDSTSTLVNTSADLQMDLTGSNLAPLLNEPVTFTAISQNVGPSDAQNVSITMSLAPHFLFSALTSNGASCTSPQVGTTGAITCSWAGATAVDAAHVLEVVATYNNQGSSSVNATTVSDTFDPSTTNNTGNFSVQAGLNTGVPLPALNPLGLILLSLTLGLFGFAAVRRSS